KRAIHGRLAQTSSDGNAFAEADDAGEAVNDAKAVIVRPGYQQSTVIGAKVERRIKRPAVLASRIDGGRCPLVRINRDPVGPCPLHLVKTSWRTACRSVQRQSCSSGPIGIGHIGLLMCAVAGPGFGR